MATYTENFGLHQWVPEDDFLRTDFNEDFAKIDAAIQAAKAQAEDLEDSKAELVVGSYTGNGSSKTISVGFQPRMVVIAQTNSVVMPAPENTYPYITFTTSGFRVTYDAANYFTANRNAWIYTYLAVK